MCTCSYSNFSFVRKKKQIIALNTLFHPLKITVYNGTVAKSEAPRTH